MGRIQTLPSSASSHDENTSCTGSDPQSQTVIPNDQDLQPHISHQTTKINAYDGGSNLSPLLHKYETSIEGSRASASEVSGEVVKLPTVSPIDQSSPASTLGLELNLEQQTQRRRLFTLNQISSAIAAAEGTRLFCSAIIAIFVMLSYLGFPLPGSYIIKSIISFRPLYIVLLTNATIVLTRLTFDKQRDFEWAARDESETPLNGYGWAE
ncbi:hypothetical protein I3760_08G022600 [Carya illinoinensis]|nr:hypothetical protein I3760_08G022600 [Carya illinoinensis]